MFKTGPKSRNIMWLSYYSASFFIVNKKYNLFLFRTCLAFSAILKKIIGFLFLLLIKVNYLLETLRSLKLPSSVSLLQVLVSELVNECRDVSPLSSYHDYQAANANFVSCIKRNSLGTLSVITLNYFLFKTCTDISRTSYVYIYNLTNYRNKSILYNCNNP